ncbi:hypothetical protein DRO64_10700 [Candidatus Bathyarchaeota archaeon]|nr:MAG: hypothetical protein DRO64_10700 [Candidatus Bathyarchaeota archaeon]
MEKGLLQVAISFIVDIIKVPFLGTIVQILQALYQVFSESLSNGETIPYFEIKLNNVNYNDELIFIIVLESQTPKDLWRLTIFEEYEHVFGPRSENISQERTIEVSRTEIRILS